MTAIIVNSVGILLAIGGTVLTLWTTFITVAENIGKWIEPTERAESFPKEKCRAIVGCVLIAVGGTAQIVSQFLR